MLSVFILKSFNIIWRYSEDLRVEFWTKAKAFPVTRYFSVNLAGEYEKGVDHLTNAIAVCGQPQQLLQVLQQTLPPPVFQMLLTKLPTISQVKVWTVRE